MCCRFRCPGPGVFQCALTGLVFVMAEEAELLYNTVQWDESLLQSAGGMAAGPLFKIKSSEEAAVCQLHLPHCETKDGKQNNNELKNKRLRIEVNWHILWMLQS